MAIHPKDVVWAICWRLALSIFLAVYGRESRRVLLPDVCTRVVFFPPGR